MAWASTHLSLLSRVRNPEDHHAWTVFESRYGDLIVRYCRSRGLQLTDAEDVRQVVLMSLSRSMRGFNYLASRGRFRTYLACVVRNAIFRLKRCPETLQGDLSHMADEVREVDDTPDELWDKEWMDHHLRRAIRTVRQSLRSQSMRVFERLLSGGTMSEAASEFGMSVEAVKKIQQRVRLRLTQEIALQIEEEDPCA